MIKDNIVQVKERIASACSRANRQAQEIMLVGVTKNRQVIEVKELLAGGITQIGENRVQEAAAKYAELGSERVSWHLIGHLQTNKVKDAVRIFDLIQSVDSLRLAQAINKEAEKVDKVQEILLEVKTSPEPTKHGLSAEDLLINFKQILGLKNIRLRGLMTIAPLVDEPENARPYFRQLRKLRDELYRRQMVSFSVSETGGGGLILSMGMTGDFEVAIEEGSQMVRLGRALFE